MKRIMLSLLLWAGACSPQAVFEENSSIKAVFEAHQAEGCFVLWDTKNLSGYNKERAYTQFIPASTFKIPHSLIALDVQAVSNVDEVFYIYNQSPVFLESWKSDASLRSAIKISQVPAYKELALKIGQKAMAESLQKLGYGNKDIGANSLTNFWLEGPLKISAVEQAEFLSKLALETLPYPKELQAAVKDICLLESGKDWALYGKTGLADNVGWFVGWVEKDEKIYSFALNMEIDPQKSEQLPLRISISKEILTNLGLIS